MSEAGKESLPAEPVETAGREGGEDLPDPLLRRLGGGVDRGLPRFDRAVERLAPPSLTLLLLVARLVRRRLAGPVAPRLLPRSAVAGPVLPRRT
jgi:hypothetical protein